MLNNPTVFWVLMVVLGLMGLAWLLPRAAVAVSAAHRGRFSTGSKVFRWALVIAALAAAIWSGTHAYALGHPAGDPPAPPVVTNDSQQSQAETFPEITLTELELQQMFGAYSRVFDDSSMPIRAQERIAATKAAMIAAGYKEDQVFQDGVAFPIFTDEQLKSLQDKKLSAEEKQAIFDQVRKDFYQCILANPVVGDMVVQGLCEIPYITDSNPWLLEFRDTLNQSVNPTTGKGWLTWLVASNAQATEFTTSDEYFYGAARVCAVLEYFDFQELTTKESAGNWSLAPAGEADYIRTQKSDYEESAEAVMLVHRQKSGEDKIQLGVNVFDGRLEIFDVTKPAPDASNPPNTTTTTGTSYTLYVKYVYTDGTAAAPTHSESHKEGESYSVTSPTISGYTADKKVVSGTMPASNKTVTVTYSRNVTTPTSFTLTVNYVYSTGGQAAPSVTKQLQANEWYSITSPTINGWKADQLIVSGNMPARDYTVTVTYRQDTHSVTIYYKYENGKSAASTYVKEGLVYGETYRVESPTIKGYAPDKAVVSGTMYDKDIEVTVTYYPSTGRLTIYYQFKDGSRAAPTYSKDYGVGEDYWVDSPTVKGYTPTMAFVYGTMTKEGRTVTVLYTKDGQGQKDPAASSQNNGNANTFGGVNNPNDSDTTGSYQPNNPPQHDYGTGGNQPTGGNNSSSSGTSTPSIPAGSTGDNVTPPSNTPDNVHQDTTVNGSNTSNESNTTPIGKPS